MEPEQLIGIVRAEIAKLHAFQFMDEALTAVIEAKEKRDAFLKEAADLDAKVSAAQAMLDDITARGHARMQDLDDAWSKRQRDQQERMDALDREFMAGVVAHQQRLEGLQAQMRDAEAEAKARLDAWDQQLKAVQQAHADAAGGLEAAKQEMLKAVKQAVPDLAERLQS